VASVEKLHAASLPTSIATGGLDQQARTRLTLERGQCYKCHQAQMC